MSDHDVFAQTPSPITDDVNDLLAAIKNENGEPKYRSVPDALKALGNSQAFIPQLLNEKKTLEEEMNQLREQAKKAQNMEELLEQLKTAGKEQKEPAKETPSAIGLSEEAVAALVKKTLEEREGSVRAKSNFERVNGELVKKFGIDKAKEVVAKKAQDLGTTPEQLARLSAESPELVLALFGESAAKPAQPTTSSVNLPFTPAPSGVERPKKSLLLGATSRDQKELMMKIKEDVYRRHGVTQ